MDWLSSPDWPVDKPHDAFATSPNSTPLFYTSANGDSWNYIDASFKQEAIQSSSLTSSTTKTYANSFSAYPHTISQPDRNRSWDQGNFQAANVPYFPFSPIHDLPDQIKDREGDLREEKICSIRPLSTSTYGSSPQSPGKTPWGPSKEAHKRSGSYKSAKSASQIKEKTRKPPHRRTSSSNAKEESRLHGNKTGPRIDYREKNDVAGTDSTDCLRVAHNLIEKRYRTKLNDQFSILWNALPLDVTGDETNGDRGRDCGGIERKVSKAEVLVHARAHIQNLERTKRNLEGDRKALQDDLERLKAAWVNMGGQVMR